MRKRLLNHCSEKPPLRGMHANVRIHDHRWIAVAPDDETGFGKW